MQARLSSPLLAVATHIPSDSWTVMMVRRRRFSRPLGMAKFCHLQPIGSPPDDLRVIVSRFRPPIALMSPILTPTVRCITANPQGKRPDTTPEVGTTRKTHRFAIGPTETGAF